jgi:hypothetical protein
LTIDNWIVCWNPAHHREPGEVLVARLGDDRHWDRRYAHAAGMCMTARHNLPLADKVMMMFIDFHTLVVRDGIDPQAAHREFLKIDEYRQRIAPGITGAEPQ